MIAKLTAKNQLTLPSRVVRDVGAERLFEIDVQEGRLVLTPVSIHRADIVHVDLKALNIDEHMIAAAVYWTRQQ